MKVAFDDFVLDIDAFELRHDDTPVAMEPQVFEVLAELVRNEGQLVTKEDLLERVWGDQFVSESALTSRIKAARQALGDDGRQQRYIKTVHGRGYRFAATTDRRTVVASSDDTAVDARSSTDNLPSERTALIGRSADVAHCVDLVEQHRLVSLIGLGGVGKTRVAIATGRQLIDRVGGGVWFVDLVPVTDERSIAGAIARAAGLALTGGSSATELARMIADRDAVFILDNCEHLVDAVAATVDELLSATSAARFLVTSRVPLDLLDERRINVAPLVLGERPEPGPATQLLLTSAERFAVDTDELDTELAWSVCRQLDGLPLAIELAAAQLRHLTLADLASRLEHRFEILEARRRSGHDRHAGLAGILDETWARLEPAQVDLLVHLSVFPGAFTLDDVEEVMDHVEPTAVARGLAGLVDLSLVNHHAVDGHYRLLETVRLFSRQHSDDHVLAAATERHIDWCRRRVGSSLVDQYHDFVVAEWAMSHADDLRAAESSLRVAGRLDEAAMLLAAPGLAMHLDLGTRAADSLERIERLVPVISAPDLRTRLHLTGAMSAMAARSPGQLRRHGLAALEAAKTTDDPSLTATAFVLASWSTVSDDPEQAMDMVDEARRLAEAARDGTTRDLADSYRAFHLATLRRWDEAVRQARAVVERRSDSHALYAHYSAAVAASSCLVLDDPDAAADLFAIVERAPAGLSMWGNQVLRASISASQGRRIDTAREVGSVEQSMRRSGLSALPDILVPAAILAHRLDHDGRAARWLRAVRDADRPTQNFQVTFMFRRARDLVGVDRVSPLESSTLDEVGDEALGWLASLVDDGGRA